VQVTRRLVGAPLAAVFTQRVRHMPAVGVAAAQVPGGDADQRCRLVHFDEGQRKDDVLQKYLAGHDGSERVLFVGRAQEKTRVISSVRRRNRSPGPATRGWGAEARWSPCLPVLLRPLWEVAFPPTGGLLRVQRISHDPITGADAFAAVNNPTDIDGQHAGALRFGDPRAQARLEPTPTPTPCMWR
jgi:hypothetical protein